MHDLPERCGNIEKDSDEEAALAGIDAMTAFIKEIGLAPTTFRELGVPDDTDFRAIANSTNITAGCSIKLTHDEIYEIFEANASDFPERRRIMKKLTALLLSLALVLGLAACGNGDRPTATQSPTAAALS